MRVADVFAALRLDTTEFKKGLQNLNAEVNTASRNWGRSLTSFGKSTQKLGRSMTTNLTLPILAAGGATAKFALDFDTTLRRVVGLTDVTAAQIGGIRDQILALGADIGKTPQDLAQAFYFVASAGFEADEAFKVLEISAKASAAGMGETQDIAKILGAAINAYGKENLTAAQAGDILTAAVSDGAAEADAFAAVLGRVIPVSASMGVSFDQVTAALAAMTLSGVDADEAATQLRQIFVSLLKPTTEAESALSGLGLSSEGLRKQLQEQGLLATLRTLDDRFAGNSAAIAEVFGNVRALTGVNNLLNLSESQLAKIFGDTANSLGALQGAYDATAGPQREIDKAMASLQATAIELGQDTLPIVVEVFRNLADTVAGFAKWWRSLDEGMRSQIVQWLAWVAVAGPALLLVGKLASGLGALFRAVAWLTGPKGLALLVSRFGTVGAAAGAALGPIGLFVAAIAAIGFGAKEVDRALDPLGAKIDDLASTVGKDMKSVYRDTKDLADKYHQPIDTISQLVLDAAEKYGLNWDEAFQHVEANLRLHGGEVVDNFDVIGYHAQQALKAHQDQITTDMGDLPPEIAAILGDGAGAVGDGATTMTDEIAKALQAAKEAAMAKGGEIQDALLSGLTQDPDAFEKAFEDFLDRVSHPYNDLVRRADIESALAAQGVRDGLRSEDSRVRADTRDYVNGLIAQYESIAPGALDSGELVNPALWSGISGNLDELFTNIRTDLRDPLGPALTFDEIAQGAGFDGIAALYRGMRLADYQDGVKTRTDIQAAVKRDLSIDLYYQGFNTGASFASGLENAWNNRIRAKAQQIREGVQGFLEFSGSPPFTHSRLAGEGVGKSWIDALVETVKARTREVMAATSGVLAAPGFGGLSTFPSVALAPAAAAPAGGSSATTINNFNLNYTGRKDRKEVEEIIEEWQRMGRL